MINYILCVSGHDTTHRGGLTAVVLAVFCSAPNRDAFHFGRPAASGGNSMAMAIGVHIDPRRRYLARFSTCSPASAGPQVKSQVQRSTYAPTYLHLPITGVVRDLA
ncbi:hypothetical protein C8Q78DRAFT_997030 [Trametes maxima]|nr:hypothetical protein C8Q78DRAFT_997030 [Trametes maxima]